MKWCSAGSLWKILDSIPGPLHQKSGVVPEFMGSSFFYPFESYLEHLTDHRYTVCLKWIENQRGQCHNIFFLYLHCLKNSKYKVSSLCTWPSNYAKFYEVTGKFTLLTTVYTLQHVESQSWYKYLHFITDFCLNYILINSTAWSRTIQFSR